ncbi:MAG: ABC transporter permease subunit [Methanomicrobiales archaeon]|nr:ABC transporter permease subunit [Methanomicrobiales archaeon]
MDPILDGIIQAFYLIATLDPEVLKITALSLFITFSATILGSIFALPVGTVIAFREFTGKKLLINLIQTFYAFPTVVIGLIVFLFIRRTGPFGFLGFLFTPWGMIIGQTLLVLPIIAGLTISALLAVDRTITDTILSLGATRLQFMISVVKEARFAIFAAIAMAFGRAVSEVGAAIIIGGNIDATSFWGSTRTLTTAITLETGKGNIGLSIALGLILLFIALAVNTLIAQVQQR